MVGDKEAGEVHWLTQKKLKWETNVFGIKVLRLHDI